MLVCASAGPADAQTRSRRDVTDPGRVWIGTVAPPVCIGGGAAFRDGAERRAADEIVAVGGLRLRGLLAEKIGEETDGTGK